MKIKNILSLVILINIAIVSQIFTMEEGSRKQVDNLKMLKDSDLKEFYKSNPDLYCAGIWMYLVQKEVGSHLPYELKEMIIEALYATYAIEEIKKQKLLCKFFKSNPEIFSMAAWIYWTEQKVGTKFPIEILEMLAKSIVDIEVIKNENSQALLNAIGKNKINEIKQLLKKHSININVKDQNGNTALRLAAIRNYQEIVQVLLQKGANPNLQNSNGDTALHSAIINNNTEIVQMLLQEGAKFHLQNQYGDNALHIAAKYDHHKIVEILLQKCANPNLQDNTGNTALDYAAICNYPEIVEMLLQKGANPNLQDNTGNTVLYYAIRNNNTKIIQMLQAHTSRAQEK